MARLVNYKTRDENRYSTFDGEPSYTSRENLTDSNRIRLLSKQKTKLQKLKTKMAKNGNKNSNKIPEETIPTISASIEMHRNKIAQSRAINASSAEVTRGRRRPATQSRHKAGSFNSKFNTRQCNWRSNQQQQQQQRHHDDEYEEPTNRGKRCCASCCFCLCPRCWWEWCCKRKCCARICCGCIDYVDSENDDDDDIDAKFEQYKQEIRLNELKRDRSGGGGGGDTANEMQETSLQSSSYRIELSPSSTATSTTISHDDHRNPITNNEGNAINAAEATSSFDKTSKSPSIISRYRRYWSWNDSLRSNSDKFLETLEYDMDGEQSLKRTNNKHDQTDASARAKGCTPDLHVATSHA